MIRITFNSAPVLARLAEARAALTDLTPLHRDIGEYMVKATRDRFPAGTAPDGTRWRQKAPATLAAYLRRGDGARPYPLIGPSGRLGKEIALLVTKGGAEIGSALEYSAIHQFGGTIKHPGGTAYQLDGKRKAKFVSNSKAATDSLRTAAHDIVIPARPWLGVSAEDERTIIEIADEYLAEEVDE